MPLSGRSGEIADAGLISSNDLARAMRVKDAAELDAHGEDNFAEPLGLRYHEGASGYRHSYGNTARPTILEGSREGRQVFIRIGWLGAGAPQFFLTFRLSRYRQVTSMLVAAPEFQLRDSEGRLTGDTTTPPEVTGVIDGLAPSSDVWRGLRVVSGPEGMVVSRRIGRPSGGIGFWIYDLWLLERLADALGAQALPARKRKRDWTVPYGLGDRVPK